ncbi:MAG: hypothetical protein PHZ11_09170 [Desulfitobacteriaceae bacterium]|nr:hypothetical protein [Desulfitobacteriaceae bacterium]MDD4347033.1 hypothetical protein [Desulfitobacteriaceae bacterium]
MGKNIDYMMELVNEYLSGKTPQYISGSGLEITSASLPKAKRYSCCE